MQVTEHSNRYSPISIAMHWLMLLLIVAVYACIELREFYPKGSDPREALKMWHFMLGLSVWILIWVRLFLKAKGHQFYLHHHHGNSCWRKRFISCYICL